MTSAVIDEDMAIELWRFLMALDEALACARGSIFHRDRRQLEAWHKQVLAALKDPTTVVELQSAWPTFPELPLASHHSPDLLLRDEVRAVTELMSKAAGVRIAREGDLLKTRTRNPFKRVLARIVGVKDALKAGGTVLGSIKDLLDKAPAWLQSLLVIGKEAVDTVT